MGSGPELEVLCDSTRIALVGSGGGLEIKGREQPLVPPGQTVRVTKGEMIRVKLGGDAFCSYLAIEGGVDVPLCLNSKSTYTRAAFGGFSKDGSFRRATFSMATRTVSLLAKKSR